MPEKRYFVVPSDFSFDNIPSDELEKLHLEGPDEHNADIVALERGMEVDRMMYRDNLARKWDADLPPVKSKRSGGGEVEEVLGKPEPPELRKGCTPILQFLYNLTDVEKGAEFDEIWGKIEELNWFENVGFIEENNIKSALNTLQNHNVVTYDGEYDRWVAGPRTLDMYFDFGDDGYEIKSGEYPTVRLIRDFLSDNGSAKRYEVVDEVMDWGFARTRSEAEKWVDYALDSGFVRHIGEDVLEAHRSLG